LKHETLHLVFKHLFRELHNKDHELMNLAADIVVNQYIGEWELPESAITLSTFPDLELEPGQTMEYYYDRLAALKGKKGKGKTKGKVCVKVGVKGLGQNQGRNQSENQG
jgi:predicted metal-dependent peptidase